MSFCSRQESRWSQQQHFLFDIGAQCACHVAVAANLDLLVNHQWQPNTMLQPSEASAPTLAARHVSVSVSRVSSKVVLEGFFFVVHEHDALAHAKSIAAFKAISSVRYTQDMVMAARQLRAISSVHMEFRTRSIECLDQPMHWECMSSHFESIRSIPQSRPHPLPSCYPSPVKLPWSPGCP